MLVAAVTAAEPSTTQVGAGGRRQIRQGTPSNTALTPERCVSSARGRRDRFAPPCARMAGVHFRNSGGFMPLFTSFHRKRRSLAPVGIALAIPAALSVVASPASAATLTVLPAADSYVRSD